MYPFTLPLLPMALKLIPTGARPLHVHFVRLLFYNIEDILRALKLSDQSSPPACHQTLADLILIKKRTSDLTDLSSSISRKGMFLVFILPQCLPVWEINPRNEWLI